MVRIRPLTRRKVREALNLINAVFPGKQEEPPDEELPASLAPRKYRKYFLKTSKSYIKYWIAVNDSGGIAGIVGLYCYQKDEDEAFWLGWFCVKLGDRRKGIGGKLLRFAINKARKKGKVFLRLDTSTDPNESAACRLYEKHGLRLTGRECYFNENIEKLYYELKL